MSDPQVISMLYEVLVAQSKYESRGLEHRSRLKANYHRLVRENAAHRDLSRKFPKQQLNKMLVSLADSVRVLDATELQPTDLELCYGINQYVFPRIPDFNGLDSKFLSKWHKFYGVPPAHHRFPGGKKRQNEKKPFPMSKRRNVRDSESSSESDPSETRSPVAVLLTEDDFEDPDEDVKTEDPYEPPAPALKREEQPVYSEFPEPDEGHVRLPIVMSREVEFGEDSIVFGLMEDEKLGEWVSTSSFEAYRQLYRQIYFFDPSLKISPAFKHEIEPPMTEEEARRLREKDKDSQKKVKDENVNNVENKNINVNTNVNTNANNAENKNINVNTNVNTNLNINVNANANTNNAENKNANTNLNVNINTNTNLNNNLNENKDPNGDLNRGDNQIEEENAEETQKAWQEPVADRPKGAKRGKSPFKSERAAVSASRVDASKCYRSDLRGKVSIRERKNELEELQDAGLHALGEQQPEAGRPDPHTDSSEDAGPSDALIGASNFCRKAKFMKLPGNFRQNTEHFDPAAIFGNYYCPVGAPADASLREDSANGHANTAKQPKNNQTTSSTTLVDSQERPDSPHSSDANTRSGLSQGSDRPDSPHFMSLSTATVDFMQVDSVYSCTEHGNFEVRCSAKYRLPLAPGVRSARTEGALGVYQELQLLLKQLFALKRSVSGSCSVCSGWNLLHGIAQAFCEFCEDRLADAEPELLLKVFEIRRYIASVLYPIVGYKYQVLDLFGSGELAPDWQQLLGAQRVSIQALTQVGASFPKASLHDARWLPSPVALPRSICDAINGFQFPKSNQPEPGGQQAREECATPINTPTGHGAPGAGCEAEAALANAAQLEVGAPRPASERRLQSYGLMELVNYRRRQRARMLNDFLEQLHRAYHARAPGRRSAHLVSSYVNVLKNGLMLSAEFVVPENAGFELDSDEADSSESECVEPKSRDPPKGKEAAKNRDSPKSKDSPKNKEPPKTKDSPKKKELYYDEDASFVLTRLPLDTDMIKLSFYHRGVFQCKTGALRTYAFAQVAAMFGFREGRLLAAAAAAAKQQEFQRLASMLSCSEGSDSALESVRDTQNVYASLQTRQSVDDQPPDSNQNTQNAQNNQLPKSEPPDNTQNVHEALHNATAARSVPVSANAPVQAPKSEPAKAEQDQATSPRKKTRARRAPRAPKPEPGKKTRKERKGGKGDAKTGHKPRGRPRLEPKPGAEPKPKPRGRGRRRAEAKKPKAEDARPEKPEPEPEGRENRESPGAPAPRAPADPLLCFSYGWHECLVRHLGRRAFLSPCDAASSRELVERLVSRESAGPAEPGPPGLFRALLRYRLLENMPPQVLSSLYTTGKVKIGFPTSLEMYILGLPDALMDRSMYGGVGRGFMYSLDAIVHNLALLSTLIRIGGTLPKRRRGAK